MNIYLDANLWNVLCDQQVDPEKLVTSLAAKNVDLVLGLHVFYELAKTFRSPTKKALERGAHLFSYLKDFVGTGIPCVKENDELLAAEMWALKRGAPIEVFLSRKDRLRLSKAIENLATGGFDERTAKFIQDQKAFASDVRRTQMLLLKGQPDAKQSLKNISPEKLTQWLDSETYSPAGSANLKDHIRRRFPEASESDAMEWASELLKSPASHISRGFVRTSSYYLWRCAYRDSIPKDLFDDTYHVLNSIHCNIYTTGDKKQAQYAALLRPPNTRVEIYTSKMGIGQWLYSLA